MLLFLLLFSFSSIWSFLTTILSSRYDSSPGCVRQENGCRLSRRECGKLSRALFSRGSWETALCVKIVAGEAGEEDVEDEDGDDAESLSVLLVRLEKNTLWLGSRRESLMAR